MTASKKDSESAEKTTASSIKPETAPKKTAYIIDEIIPDVFDTIDIAMAQIDLNYRVVKFNRKATEIYGEDALGDFCYHMAAKCDAVCDDCPARGIHQRPGR